MRPTVSIVMPVLNGERYIAEALESICRQTYTSFELFVVDDGSTDRTRQIVERFAGRIDLKYVHHPVNRGIAPSANDAIRRASGDLIAFLDHDDLWLPEFLETQVGYLREHPDVGMVHSDIQTIDGEGKVLEHSALECRGKPQPSGHVFRSLFTASMICGNSVVLRKECFDRVGLWDEELRWADYHLWLRVSRHYKIDYVPKVLTAYRQHASQNTRTITSRPADEPPVGAQAIEKLLLEYPEIRNELGKRMINRRMASFFSELAYQWFRAGEFANARRWLRRALRYWPTNRRYLGLYAATLLGPWPLRAFKEASRRLRGRTELAGDVRG